MKLRLTLLLVLFSVVTFSQALRPRSRYGAISARSSGDDSPMLDIFSLSLQGDFGLSTMYTGIRKIFEGIATCKFLCKSRGKNRKIFIFPYVSVIDLKLIRHFVDYFTGWIYPSAAELESEMGPLLASRSDNSELEYQLEDSDPQLKEAYDTIKAKETFGTVATTFIGAMMHKQKCYERSACTIGKYMEQFKGRDVAFV